jgi:hypothetical protein
LDVTNGRAVCEACSAKWNLGTNSAFSLGSRKTTEKLDLVGRSQDRPDADRQQNTRTLSLFPVFVLLLSLRKNLVFFCTLDEQETVVNFSTRTPQKTRYKSSIVVSLSCRTGRLEAIASKFICAC